MPPFWLPLIAPLVTSLWALSNWKRNELTLDLPNPRGTGRVPEVTLVLFQNSGNQVIESKDFERPLQFILDASDRFVDARILLSEPPEVQPVLTREPQSVTIAPLLLNPGDSFVIRLLTEGRGYFALDTRISGVRRLTYGTGWSWSRAVAALAVVAPIVSWYLTSSRVIAAWVDVFSCAATATAVFLAFRDVHRTIKRYRLWKRAVAT